MNKKAKKNSNLAVIWRNFRRNKTAMIGFVFLILILLVVIFADVIVDYDKAIIQDASIRLQKPSAAHWFGTDNYGRDVFARVIHGSRTSLIIAITSTAGALLCGGILGAVAGYYGGAADNIIMRIMDILMCIPALLLALAVVAALGSNTVNLVVAISLSTAPGYARIVRASLLSVSGQAFVEAAKSYGANDFRIVFKYIIPNAMGPIIVQATMGVASIILAASALSYLGMGVQAPAPEWGAMLSDARDFLQGSGYLLYIPGFAIVLSALSFNLAGDGLRDAMDPKLRR